MHEAHALEQRRGFDEADRISLTEVDVVGLTPMNPRGRYAHRRVYVPVYIIAR